jgi:hypothetical protein
MKCPDKAGILKLLPTDQLIEVYELEPCNNVLCIWGPEVGISYTGARETQGFWNTDEWQGHIPVHLFDSYGPWELMN